MFMATESKGPRTKMLLVYVGATDSRSFLIRYAVHFHCFHMFLSMFAVLFSHGSVHVFSVRLSSLSLSRQRHDISNS